MEEQNMNPVTDALIIAITDWVTMAMAQPLTEEKRRELERCTVADGADVRVVMALREGALVLEGTAKGKWQVELYREDVPPLRPADYFGHQDDEGKKIRM
jgi:hypothetical protein